jgi:hypothetical protein
VYRYEVIDAARRRAQWIIDQLRAHDGLTASPEVTACAQVLSLTELVEDWQQDKGQAWNWDLVFDDEPDGRTGLSDFASSDSSPEGEDSDFPETFCQALLGRMAPTAQYLSLFSSMPACTEHYAGLRWLQISSTCTPSRPRAALAVPWGSLDCADQIFTNNRHPGSHVLLRTHVRPATFALDPEGES